MSLKASTGRDADLMDYIEESIVLDDAKMFDCLNITLDQAINFIYK